MILIKKGESPRELAKAKGDMKDSPGSTVNYDHLPPEYKGVIRKSLVEEQGFLCAYCMKRIGLDNSSIEHIVPRHDKDGISHDAESLDYSNMIAVCDGGKNSGAVAGPRRAHLTCDAHKGNRTLEKVNPLKRETLRGIGYRADGIIYSDDDEVDRDLNNVLNLNDEQTPLPKNRKAVLDQVNGWFVREIKKHHFENDNDAKKRLCLRKLQDLEAQTEKKEEFAGVMVFRLEKLAKKFGAAERSK